MPVENYIFSDLSLSRRLERTEGLSCASFVEARATLSPQTGACYIEVAGALAMFDGVDSPISQTFGLGVFQPVSENELIEIEDFFTSRGCAVNHEVSPLAEMSTFEMLYERRYKPIEFTSVMFRGLQAMDSRPASPEIAVRIIDTDEAELWARISAEGWSEYEEIPQDIMYELGLMSARRPGGLSFIAEKNGEPIATGGLSIQDGVALLAGASTIPSRRKLGAQNALLESRLGYAREQGCDIAMMCAQPGSSSQRNAERNGFRIAYTRTKWMRG